MSTTDQPPWGDAEDDVAVREEFAEAGSVAEGFDGATHELDELGLREAELRRRSAAQRPQRPRRTSPPRRRAGVTRRQWMRRAVAGSLGLSAAGLVGYE